MGTLNDTTRPRRRHPLGAWRLALLGASVLAARIPLRADAGPAAVPPEELHAPPTEARVAAIVDAAASGGWSQEAAILRRAAFDSYATGNLAAAEAWLNLERWAELLGRPEPIEILRWIRAVEDARVAHANLPQRYAMRKGVTMSVWLPRDVQRRLAMDPEFLDAFLGQLSPCDYLPEVLGILGRLERAGEGTFRDYRSLAIAIALVYDTPPPPFWPHAQVGQDLLKRKLPDPLEAFRFFVGEDRAGHCYQNLRKLGPDELKFVVDVAASFDELRWSQQVVDLPLARLDKAYSMVRYRMDRLKNGRAVWPDPSYTLPQILGYGGICVDQAYFACEVGKARGVPTLLFMGAGMDGRHAWFGYLDGRQRWQLDAGRYAEQRFVTGAAIDPQTWGWLTDHDLRFLSERFQRLETTRRSRFESDFARAFLEAGLVDEAEAAARRAVGIEGRNLAAWETLIAIARKRGDPARVLETTYRQAALAYSRYPDLETRFTDLLVASLRARGETSMADYEQSRIIHKYRGNRTDLAIQEAAKILARSFAQGDLPAQIRTYNQVLDRYGKGTGTLFFDGIVKVFVEHLLQMGQPKEALEALRRARATIGVEPGSPLDQEFSTLERRIRQG